MNPVLASILAGQFRHLLTGLAGVLVTAGAIDASQSDSFIIIASGLLTYAVGAVWSFFQKKG